MNTVESNRFQIVNRIPMTTSRDVAEVFNKRHADVIRNVESLQVPDTWYKRNFALIQKDTDLGLNRTRQDKAYRMTKDGFVLLVMGFTGKKASAFKIAYIEAFNRMSEELSKKSIPSAPETSYQPMLLESSEQQTSQLIYRDKTVMPNNAAAYLLGVTRSTLNTHARKNRDMFMEGEDWFKVSEKELDELKRQSATNSFIHIHNAARSVIVWTKQGFRRLCGVTGSKGSGSYTFKLACRTYFDVKPVTKSDNSLNIENLKNVLKNSSSSELDRYLTSIFSSFDREFKEGIIIELAEALKKINTAA